MNLNLIRLDSALHLLLLVASALPALAGSAAGADALLVQDAYVSATKATKTFGNKPTLALTETETVFMQFDLSTLPAGTASSAIQKANLWLWVGKVKSPGTFGVRRVTQAWTEETVSGMIAPQTIAGVEPTAVIVEADDEIGYVVVDLTALAQGWVAKTVPNFGIALLGAPGASFAFDSKENTKTGKAPRLELQLSASGAQGPQGPQGPMGPQGTAGPVGPAGPKGDKGATGANGATGAQGPAGATGATGSQGPSGFAGYKFATSTGSGGILSSLMNTTSFLPGLPTVTVTIAAGQKVSVDVKQGFHVGTLPELVLMSIAYRKVGTTTLMPAGVMVQQTIVPGGTGPSWEYWGTSSTHDLNAVLDGLTPGTYEIGIQAQAYWNSQDAYLGVGSVRALIFN